jgi:hypothetical protein
MSETDEAEGANLQSAADEGDAPEASVQNPGPIPVDVRCVFLKPSKVSSTWPELV